MKKHAIRFIAAAGLAAIVGGGIMLLEVLLLNESFSLAAIFGLGALCVVFPTALILGAPLYYCHVRFRGHISSWLVVYLLVGAIGSVIVMISLFPFTFEAVTYNYQLIVLPGLIGLGASFAAWILVCFGPLKIEQRSRNNTTQRTGEGIDQ